MSEDYIDGEVIREPSQAVAVHAGAQQVKVFNPLDHDPIQFKAALVNRQDNYDALRDHLRGVLVPGEDFGKIHVAKRSDCPDGQWKCTQRSHWSKDTLFDSGGDKILGLLGLGIAYPDIDDYRKAALNGVRIADVIMNAKVINNAGLPISEGSGAASVEQEGKSLNNAIKKAQKRARLDAINRLPGVSALFEDAAWVASIAPPKGGTAAPQRHGTGATLLAMPFGKHKDKPFTELEDDYLHWIIKECANKPDVFAAAERELALRAGQKETAADVAKMERDQKKPAPKRDVALDQVFGPPKQKQQKAQVPDEPFYDDELPPLSAYE